MSIVKALTVLRPGMSPYFGGDVPNCGRGTPPAPTLGSRTDFGGEEDQLEFSKLYLSHAFNMRELTRFRIVQ